MKYNRNVYQALTMIMQFGINMLVPIFLCSFVGMYLDRKFNTSFWMILLFFVGTLAGFTNVFRFARKIYETPAVTRRRSTVAADKDGREHIRAEQIQDDRKQVKAEQIQDGREQVRAERIQDGREQVRAEQIQDDWEQVGAGRIQDDREQARARQIQNGQQQLSGERDVQKRGGI